MQVTVSRKEETSFIVEHQNDPYLDFDLIDMEGFISFHYHDNSRPQCCEYCEAENNGSQKGGCPCPIAMSSL